MVTNSQITRAEVARKAGVSKTTVSYVLNDTLGARVSESTRARVRRAARALGYEPDFAATCMKRGRTEIVGLLVPRQTKQRTPFYSHMISGILEASADSDYHFLHLSQERWDKVKRCLARNYVDGLVVIQSHTDHQILRRLQSFDRPVVTLNQLHDLSFPQVTMDYEEVMRKAVNHLVQRASRHLLFVHGTWDNQPVQRLLDTYKRLAGGQDAAFSTMGLEHYTLSTDAMHALATGPWDAIIIDGYELARSYCQYREVAFDKSVRPLVVFSETPRAAPLGEKVLIYQSQPVASGRRCWELMRALLNGDPCEDTAVRVPYRRLEQLSC